MNIFSTPIEWLLLLVFCINFAGIALLSGKDRFWLPCIGIWICLFTAYLIGAAFQNNRISYRQVLIDEGIVQSGSTKEGEQKLLEEAKEKKHRFGRKMLHLLGFHSFVSLFWLAIGYKVTGEGFYRPAMGSFAVICLVYLLLVFL